MRIALTLIGAVLVVVTLLSLWPSEVWWLRLMAFPRLQIGIALLACAGILVAALWRGGMADVVLLVALLGAALLQGAWILPYTALHPVESVGVAACDPPGARLRLLAANVKVSNRYAERFLDLVRAVRPDLVLAVEGDAWWDERLVAALGELLPHAVRRPRDNGYGMHLFSRHPLRDVAVLSLVEDDRPSMHATVVLPGGAAVRLHGLHPVPPHMRHRPGERDEAILAVARMVAQDATPAIVAGDFNAVAWSHTTHRFQRIGNLLDPRVGRGVYPTFPALPWLLRWPIDHVFHTTEFRLAGLEIGPDFGSDHLPVIATLCLAREGG